METGKMEDRRVFERFPVRFPSRFLDMTYNHEGRAEVEDVGAKGLRLLADEELKVHTPLEVWLDIPDKGEPLYTRGEVVWSHRTKGGSYDTGINLEKANLMGLSRILRSR
jgi:hypothetical protein